MKVNIVVFGRLKDRFGGRSSLEITMVDPAKLRQAIRAVEAGGEPLGADVAVAVNGRIVRGDADLQDGDEVLLLPPVSGG
ncbi:MAG: MoaD/ThiS family protein [Candidatus Coatesbacteria bacterium]